MLAALSSLRCIRKCCCFLSRVFHCEHNQIKVVIYLNGIIITKNILPCQEYNIYDHYFYLSDAILLSWLFDEIIEKLFTQLLIFINSLVRQQTKKNYLPLTSGNLVSNCNWSFATFLPFRFTWFMKNIVKLLPSDEGNPYWLYFFPSFLKNLIFYKHRKNTSKVAIDEFLHQSWKDATIILNPLWNWKSILNVVILPFLHTYLVTVNICPSVWFLSFMNCNNMNFQVLVLWKANIAEFTLKWFCSFMNSFNMTF